MSRGQGPTVHAMQGTTGRLGQTGAESCGNGKLEGKSKQPKEEWGPFEAVEVIKSITQASCVGCPIVS